MTRIKTDPSTLDDVGPDAAYPTTGKAVAREFIPSPQQSKIFNWLAKGKGNAFCQAVAGAGKSTTIVKGVSHIFGQVICVAFSKDIATELGAKLQAEGFDWKKAQSGTFQSLGFKALRTLATWPSATGAPSGSPFLRTSTRPTTLSFRPL
jgi:hypothetical protein